MVPTVGVNERKDVEVIAVEESLSNVVARLVSIDELFRDVLNSLHKRQRYAVRSYPGEYLPSQ
jgi:hypothetical protein